MSTSVWSEPVTIRRRGWMILRSAAPVPVVAAVFGFALPRFASYRSVWTSVHAMPWPDVLLVAVVAVVSMITCWTLIRSVLPSVRLREAAAVNLGSTAVANTLPAGGALAVGVSWTMLRGCGISTADYVLYSMVSGIWNVLARLGLPVLAVLIMMTAARPPAILIAAAAGGLVLLAAATAGFCLFLRSASFALRAGPRLQFVVAAGCRLARRQPPTRVAESLAGFRDRAAALLAARGWRITAATAASHLSLWLVLLACLRGTGLSQAQVPWQTSLAAFAFVRLLTALPITPGGLGITELGLVGVLGAGAGHRGTVQVTAAVLLYRAVTYLPSIPLGVGACLAWRFRVQPGAARPGSGGPIAATTAGPAHRPRLRRDPQRARSGRDRNLPPRRTARPPRRLSALCTCRSASPAAGPRAGLPLSARSPASRLVPASGVQHAPQIWDKRWSSILREGQNHMPSKRHLLTCGYQQSGQGLSPGPITRYDERSFCSWRTVSRASLTCLPMLVIELKTSLIVPSRSIT